MLVVKLVEERGVLVMALEDGRYNLGEEQCVLVKLGPPGRLGTRQATDSGFLARVAGHRGTYTPIIRTNNSKHPCQVQA